MTATPNRRDEPLRAPDGAPELAGLAACLLLAAAWLLPNHYPPWAAFHSDALAALAVLCASLGTLTLARGPVRWPLASLALGAVALIPLLQHAAGRVFFFGDALIASLYVAAFALALQSGAALQERARSALAPLLVTTLLVALLSVDIAVLQWLRQSQLGIFAADLEAGARPSANLAQPNQLATLLVLGLASALALHERRLLSAPALALASVFLAFGVGMTQSRAGYLELAIVVALGLAMRRRWALRTGVPVLLGIAVVVAAVALSWTSLSESLYLSNARGSATDVSSGRLDMWKLLLHAVAREPWWGWGWNQVSAAQAAVAGELPPFRMMTEHAHNIVLDLLLWNGVPIGALLAGAGAWWLWRHLRACRDGHTAWMLVAVLAMLAHAMVELPHDYLYLLVPVGLLAGAVEASSGAGRFATAPRLPTLAVPVAGLVLLGAIAAEYFSVEDNYRDMRFESARIGHSEVSTDMPTLHLLTQLREFLYVARHPVTAGMAEADLVRLRRVVDRFGYPPVLLRHALAEGLNGQPGRAAEAMRRLCHVHSAERCIEGLDNWAMMAAETHPPLRAVPLPQRPAP